MSEPLHISTTIGSEFTLIAAHAKPTSAKTTNITALMLLNVVVRKYPARKHAARSIVPICIVFLRPIFEAMLPIGIYEIMAPPVAISRQVDAPPSPCPITLST